MLVSHSVVELVLKLNADLPRYEVIERSRLNGMKSVATVHGIFKLRLSCTAERLRRLVDISLPSPQK